MAVLYPGRIAAAPHWFAPSPEPAAPGGAPAGVVPLTLEQVAGLPPDPRAGALSTPPALPPQVGAGRAGG
jgi:hypothetical protein